MGIDKLKKLIDAILELNKDVLAPNLKDGFQLKSDLLAILIALATKPHLIEPFKDFEAVWEEIKDLKLDEVATLLIQYGEKLPEAIDAWKTVVAFAAAKKAA